MPWEYRGRRHRRRYFYLARWRNGQCVKTYFGRGVAAAVAARAEVEARARRSAEAQALAVLRNRLEAPEAALGRLDAGCGRLLEATLLAAGFHRPDLKPWRRRRARRPLPA